MNSYICLAQTNLQECQLQLRLYLPPNTSQNEARKMQPQSTPRSHLDTKVSKNSPAFFLVELSWFKVAGSWDTPFWWWYRLPFWEDFRWWCGSPQKVAMAIHWEFCEVSCEFHFFPHRKLWGSQSIYINLLSSVFGRYHLSLFQRLLSKTSSIWDCMILSDIREALDWTMNWIEVFEVIMFPFNKMGTNL